MAVSSYNAIGSVTLSSAQTQVTISNIPQIYTDLMVVCSLVATTATLQNAPQLRINGDAGSNYSATALNSNGTTAASGRWSNQTVIYADYYGILQNDGIGTMTAHYMNYTNNTTYKTVLIRSGKGNKETTATTGLWRNTAAINSIQFITDSPNTFAAGTTFNLYGLGANQLKASGGDIIVSDGSYWYHAFKKSGVFTPLSTLSCNVLVIAGGGSGGTSYGNQAGGGGGAGGYQLFTSQSLSTAQTVTIGAGAAGVSSSGLSSGNSGSNSTFGSLTASIGGGKGASYSTANAVGGSGGGGANQGNMTGAAGTAGQGFAGGAGSPNPGAGAGGGGGAGAVGSAYSGDNGGAGGAGLTSESAWLTATGTGFGGVITGGGGGAKGASGTSNGSGGAGGGGGAANNTNAAPGVTNTGSGGGGVYGDTPYYTSGAGGSGIVIVRYAV